MQAQSKLTARTWQRQGLAFSRFWVVRYGTAGFFFTNLYWAFLSLTSKTGILPWSLVFVDLIMIVEQTKKYWQPSSTLPKTRWGYRLQLVSNLILLLGSNYSWSQQFVPFFSTPAQSLWKLLLIGGSISCFLLLIHIHRIERKQDAYYQRMQDLIAKSNFESKEDRS
ncbi:PTS cellobiose transporter subunit IIC [Lactobacillus sp. DCY120]|uniref:PTS cellobiose transporter subunit IIC n=1 Tax=Bombilactobacillus apium TaxID=2675299 RepID=A0A850QZP3_9LACO|nr:PTS cellobiose transporter subunit IIC [Bombilactobacillus apium]NVY96259.1 PTS cellobiose transporter subunit IIC [Bombilactobacillus apium]